MTTLCADCEEMFDEDAPGYLDPDCGLCDTCYLRSVSCRDCGVPFDPEEVPKGRICRECYLTAKADHDYDVAKDERAMRRAEERDQQVRGDRA